MPRSQVISGPLENAPLLLRTICGTFDFTGRSRRTELGWWYLGYIAANLIFETFLADHLPPQQRFFVSKGLLGLFLVPLFALFVRRVHDHGRSGWWALLLVGLVAIQIYGVAARVSFGRNGEIARQPLPGALTAVALILVLAVFALLAAPETAGPNEYGPDPRERA